MTDSKTTTLSAIWQQGIWSGNPALVQLLGLCPLLAVSNTAINGMSLGIATLFTLVLSNFFVSTTRHWLLHEIRIPVFVLLIAGIVSTIGMTMNAWAHELYLELGIFIPLIITNCAILARAETFASKNNIWPSVIDGIATGCGFALVLITLGAIRELIGTGTLLADSRLLFGPIATHWQFQLPADYRGLLIAILPPGAFIILGLLIALKNAIQHKSPKPSVATPVTSPVTSPDTINR